jgi:hypothetical protein
MHASPKSGADFSAPPAGARFGVGSMPMRKKEVTRAAFLASSAMVSLGLFAHSEKHASQSVLLDEKATGVYITFVDTYNSDYRAEGETGKRVIFRLHNNYRFTVEVAVYNVEDEPILVGNKKVDVVGVTYDLDCYSEEREKQPTKHFGSEILTVISLNAGEDLLFSVPIEHVTKRSEIRVPFQIAAESRTTKGGTEHFAFFMGQFMPGEKRTNK